MRYYADTRRKRRGYKQFNRSFRRQVRQNTVQKGRIRRKNAVRLQLFRSFNQRKSNR